jgi:putative transposase
MPNYRRTNAPGGTFFFTVVTHQRRQLFHHEAHQRLLGEVIRECQQGLPFELHAIVLLPDHLHALWSLPPGDTDFSTRWSIIKRGFSKRYLANGGLDSKVSAGKRRERRFGIWQRRFWEHMIGDDADFSTHFDYIHYNPVKHKLVTCPHQWKASSFHRWVREGVYPVDWACGMNGPPHLTETGGDFGEAY